ncbi:uncharacterized protein BDZ99DRAFT_524666 [Mytilinidion resinicola]|uniref:Uncharacterized protein n=1 Tax=Mytilinidion resinicola TaxID=574789 RepID=A0A6A6YCZ8_9PEZI|nr:uncharacterized protein BDZ99DRAFT_524666 [Mytilinidion resinicola]KAF2805717.1 hypothetical protein BDZ99DRAFT_524666 [Mytilinidion resinicola]
MADPSGQLNLLRDQHASLKSLHERKSSELRKLQEQSLCLQERLDELEDELEKVEEEKFGTKVAVRKQERAIRDSTLRSSLLASYHSLKNSTSKQSETQLRIENDDFRHTQTRTDRSTRAQGASDRLGSRPYRVAPMDERRQAPSLRSQAESDVESGRVQVSQASSPLSFMASSSTRNVGGSIPSAAYRAAEIPTRTANMPPEYRSGAPVANLGIHEVIDLGDRDGGSDDSADLEGEHDPDYSQSSNEDHRYSFLEISGRRNYLPKYPHVVCLHDGSWIELACGTCGRNCFGPDFIKGLKGFLRHLQGHGITTHLDYSDVISRCKVRDLSGAQVEALELGLPGAPEMKMRDPTYLQIEKPKITRVQAPVDDFPELPTVVRCSDGNYVELRCKLCNANSWVKHRTPYTLRPYRKWVGFRQHLRQTHKEEWHEKKDAVGRDGTAHDTILSLCIQKILTNNQLQAIRQHGASAYKVKLNPTQGPKRQREPSITSTSTNDNPDDSGDEDTTRSTDDDDDSVITSRELPRTRNRDRKRPCPDNEIVSAPHR